MVLGWLDFSLPNIPLNKFVYKNAILLVSFKKIRIYIYFAIFFVSLRKISIICYNMKVQNIYTYNFFFDRTIPITSLKIILIKTKIIKTAIHNLYALVQ